MGGVTRSRSDEPVSRPTAVLDPPTSPPHEGRGRSGGSAVGCTGDEGCNGWNEGPQQSGRCDRPPWRSGRAKWTAPSVRAGVSAARVPPREPKASDWRVGRAGSITSAADATRLPANHDLARACWRRECAEANQRHVWVGRCGTRIAVGRRDVLQAKQRSTRRSNTSGTSSSLSWGLILCVAGLYRAVTTLVEFIAQAWR